MSKTLFAVLVLFITTSCGEQTRFENSRFLAMGTWVNVTWASEQTPGEQRPNRVVEREFLRIGREYYPWGEGELAHLNTALLAGDRFQASQEMLYLIELGKEYCRASDGLFDPGVARAMDAWGFGSKRVDKPPSKQVLSKLKQDSVLHITTDENGWVDSKTHPIALDFGGYGKGYAVDRALSLLESMGIQDALVDAGGDLRVIGQRGHRPWRIAIQHPRKPNSEIAVLSLRNGEAAFTSGDYENSQTLGAEAAHHLLSPRDGRPTEHTQSVTVIADSGVLADAAATAIFVAGPAEWRGVAAALGISLVLRINSDGTLEPTEAMAERIELDGSLDDIMAQRS